MCSTCNVALGLPVALASTCAAVLALQVATDDAAARSTSTAPPCAKKMLAATLLGLGLAAANARPGFVRYSDVGTAPYTVTCVTGTRRSNYAE